MRKVFEGDGTCGPPSNYTPNGMYIDAIDGCVVVSFGDHGTDSFGEFITDPAEAKAIGQEIIEAAKVAQVQRDNEPKQE